MKRLRFYEMELLRNIAILERLSGQMFHVGFPELNRHYERGIETKSARTLMLLHNTVCRWIDDYSMDFES